MANLFLSVGGLEEHGKVALPYQMVTNMHTLAERLASRRYPSLTMTTFEFEGETHLSVIPATFSRGIRAVLPPNR